MNSPYAGEIRIFPWAQVPPGWSRCEGQVLAIKTYGRLWAAIGAAFGGDGTTNFALPDLRGRASIGTSAIHRRAQAAGEEAHALTLTEIPTHTHAAQVSPQPGDTSVLQGNVLASTRLWARPDRPVNLHPGTIGSSGGGAPHENMQPFLALAFCIALDGVPPRAE